MTLMVKDIIVLGMEVDRKVIWMQITVGFPLEMMIKGEIIMPEKCKLYNLESFTDEERQCVEDLINQIEEEKKAQKWWVMSKYSFFSKEAQELGQAYVVEPQKDSYSRSKPPLKSDFESKEAAEKWLKEYLETKKDFDSAFNDVNDLVFNLNRIREKLRRSEKITRDEWKTCFKDFDDSLNHGSLNKVTEE